MSKLKEDKIPGGLSAGMTLNDIAEKHGISVDLLVAEFKKGISVEMEHTTDREVAKEIALDHLFEDPKYYTKLIDMEKNPQTEGALFEFMMPRDVDSKMKELGISKIPISSQGEKILKGMVKEKFLDNVTNKDRLIYFVESLGKEKFGYGSKGKPLSPLVDRFWNDITTEAIFFGGKMAAYSVAMNIRDMKANGEEIDSPYEMMKEYFKNFGMDYNRSRVFDSAIRNLEEWMKRNKIQESVNEESSEETLQGLKEMAMGDLERIADYANMILDRIKQGQELDSWMYSQITLSVDQLNSVHDTMDGKDGIKESYKVAGRPVTLIKGKKADGTDWKVKFQNGKETSLSDVLSLIKPFPTGIKESVNENKIKKFDDVHIKSMNLTGMVYAIKGNDVVVNTLKKGLVKAKLDDLKKLYTDSVNEATPKIKNTISKKEWRKIAKFNKHIGMDGTHYIMKYDDKIGTYLQAVNLVDESKDGLERVAQGLPQTEEEPINEWKAEEVLQQLGGRRFMAMTGAKNFVKNDPKKQITFKIGGGAKGGINYVRITLTSMDLYNIEFLKARGTDLKVVASEKGVYNDQLQKLFTKHTGLQTRL